MSPGFFLNFSVTFTGWERGCNLRPALVHSAGPLQEHSRPGFFTVKCQPQGSGLCCKGRFIFEYRTWLCLNLLASIIRRLSMCVCLVSTIRRCTSQRWAPHLMPNQWVQLLCSLGLQQRFAWFKEKEVQEVAERENAVISMLRLSLIISLFSTHYTTPSFPPQIHIPYSSPRL